MLYIPTNGLGMARFQSILSRLQVSFFAFPSLGRGFILCSEWSRDTTHAFFTLIVTTMRSNFSTLDEPVLPPQYSYMGEVTHTHMLCKVSGRALHNDLFRASRNISM